MAAHTKTGHDDLLSSWKEIANYLQRGVRTVQRWEVELGLPVRRPAGKRRSAVIAFRSEVDEWLRSCPQELLVVEEKPRLRRNRRNRHKVSTSYQNLDRARALQEEVLGSLADLSRSIAQLRETVKRLGGSPRMIVSNSGPHAQELHSRVMPAPGNGKPPQALT